MLYTACWCEEEANSTHERHASTHKAKLKRTSVTSANNMPILKSITCLTFELFKTFVWWVFEPNPKRMDYQNP